MASVVTRSEHESPHAEQTLPGAACVSFLNSYQNLFARRVKIGLAIPWS